MMNFEEKELVSYENFMFSNSVPPNGVINSETNISTQKSKYSKFDVWKWHYENNVRHERMPRNSKNAARLYTALKVSGNLHLAGRTLLDPDVYKKHNRNFYLKLLRRFQKSLIPKKTSKVIKPIYSTMGPSKFGGFVTHPNESINHEKARELVRFITVIHSVQPLDGDLTLKSAKELSSQIEEYVSKMPGAACIGAIEIEITSIKQVRRVRDFYRARGKNIMNIDEDGVITFYRDDDQQDFRKLTACEILGADIDEKDINGEAGQFLIHFHGLLKVNKPEDFATLDKIFLTNPNWIKCSRQVLFKKLDEKCKDNHKSIEENLRFLSRYMTKCGTVLRGITPYLQYNILFPKDIGMSYDDYLKHSDQVVDNKKRQAKINNFELLDLPIYSHHEINSLALVYDGMMNFDKSRTGYIVDVGKW